MKSRHLIVGAFIILFGCKGDEMEDEVKADLIIEWQKNLGGSKIDGAYSVAVMPDMNYVVAGFTNSNDNHVSRNFGLSDAWILKLNISGNTVWERSAGGANYDYAFSMVKLADNTAVIAGSQFDDGLLSKVNVTGGLQFLKFFGGGGSENFESIIQTSDGGFIATGHTGSNGGDFGMNKGLVDAWVVKFDALGSMVWNKRFGGDNFDLGRSIIQTNDGGYLLAGQTSSTNGDITESKGAIDAWLVKLDVNGAIEWAKSYGGSGFDTAFSILVTSDGYIFVGSTSSNDGDITGNKGAYDVWIVKINNQGNILWQKLYGGSAEDFAYSVREIEGGFVLIGNSNSPDGDRSQGKGLRDVWIIEFTDTGEIIREKSFGGTGDDIGRSIEKTTNGYILVGSTTSSDGDVSNNAGLQDMWVVKLKYE